MFATEGGVKVREGHASFLQVDTMLSSSAFLSSLAFASAVGTRSMEGSKQAELSMLWSKLHCASREKQAKSAFFEPTFNFPKFLAFFWGCEILSGGFTQLSMALVYTFAGIAYGNVDVFGLVPQC